MRMAWLFVSMLGCGVVQAEEGEPLGITSEATHPHAADVAAETNAPASSAPAVTATAVAPPVDPCPEGFRCAFDRFDGRPNITEVRVHKAAHRMLLLSEDVVVRRYSVALGYGGLGPKKREGDGVTPTGTYRMTGKLAKSPWHTLIGVSYPNYDDVKRHALLKASREIPHDANIGFGIAVHGRSTTQSDGEHKNTDWTLGCIALDNDEVDEFSRVVPKGTPIIITD